jgi:hypothetical protein
MTETIFEPMVQRAKIQIGSHNNFVLVQMDKAVDYIQMTPEEAQNFAQALVDQINRIKIMNGTMPVINHA